MGELKPPVAIKISSDDLFLNASIELQFKFLANVRPCFSASFKNKLGLNVLDKILPPLSAMAP